MKFNYVQYITIWVNILLLFQIKFVHPENTPICISPTEIYYTPEISNSTEFRFVKNFLFILLLLQWKSSMEKAVGNSMQMTENTMLSAFVIVSSINKKHQCLFSVIYLTKWTNNRRYFPPPKMPENCSIDRMPKSVCFVTQKNYKITIVWYSHLLLICKLML